MSTKVKDSLHELIHSLSKSEKRYYKLYATRHMGNEGSTMIALFDYIARQSQYDEEALFLHFSGKALLNQFSTVKKRLYDQVLQSLHAFHANNSMENQVNRMLHQANLLYGKSLYDQCIRHLRSAEKLALKYDLFPAQVAINKLKNRLIETRGYRNSEEDIGQLHNATEKALSQEQLIHNLWQVKSRLFQLLQRSGKAHTHEDHELIDQLMNNIPQEDELTVYRSTESVYLYYHIHAAYHFAKNQRRESLYYTEQTIQHLSAHPNYTNERPNTLISALTNACYLAESIGVYDKSQQFLNTLKSFAEKQETIASEDLQIKLFSSRYSIELNLMLIKGQFDEARELSASVLAGLEQFGDNIMPSRKAFLLLQLAISEIGNERYHKALHRINTILNDSQLDEHESITAAAHLLNLVVHFELGNLEHLNYVVKQTQRLLKATNRLGTFEQLFLQTIQKLPRHHVVDFPDLFARLSDEWQEAGIQPDIQQLYLFDYQTWIAAKISKSSFAVKMREKYRFLTSA